MYRARIEFRGGAIFYSVEKATEHAVRELLNTMGGALVYSKSTILQHHPTNQRINSTRGSGWHDTEELK